MMKYKLLGLILFMYFTSSTGFPKWNNDSIRFVAKNADVRIDGCVISDKDTVILEFMVTNLTCQKFALLSNEEIYLCPILVDTIESRKYVMEIIFGNRVLCPFNPYGLRDSIAIVFLEGKESMQFASRFIIPGGTKIEILSAYISLMYFYTKKRNMQETMSIHELYKQKVWLVGPNYENLLYPPFPINSDLIYPAR